MSAVSHVLASVHIGYHITGTVGEGNRTIAALKRKNPSAATASIHKRKEKLNPLAQNTKPIVTNDIGSSSNSISSRPLNHNQNILERVPMQIIKCKTKIEISVSIAKKKK
eukprot:5649_1